ncbi:MAG: ankyrin repeat domain-containing protein [Sphingobacteriales bacterium]
MDKVQQAMDAMEVLDSSRLSAAFHAGVDPNMEWEGTSLGEQLVNMYLRGPGFTDCVRVIINHGWRVDDPALKAVLLDDDALLALEIARDPAVIHRTYTFKCTFTPLLNASLLHICAEYNLVKCAKVLLDAGADIDHRAGVDIYGFGGQTPIFHTVNQHNNACLPMMQLLMQHGADLHFTVAGLIWGKGYDWETFIPSVNPISYAMMGLLRQFQRSEAHIYHVVQLLMQAGYDINYQPGNIPNKYLQ